MERNATCGSRNRGTWYVKTIAFATETVQVRKSSIVYETIYVAQLVIVQRELPLEDKVRSDRYGNRAWAIKGFADNFASIDNVSVRVRSLEFNTRHLRNDCVRSRRIRPLLVGKLCTVEDQLLYELQIIHSSTVIPYLGPRERCNSVTSHQTRSRPGGQLTFRLPA